jgi:aspartate/methionine/tyrosine aminotransferase
MNPIEEWDILPVSTSSMNTVNKIRNIVDKLDLKNTNPNKSLISLSIGKKNEILNFKGDPAIYENFQVPKFVVEAVQKSLTEGKYNGYGNSCGISPARNAIAKKFSTKLFMLTTEVILQHFKKFIRMSLLQVLVQELWK